MGLARPAAVPPEVQSCAVAVGPHTWKSTVPVTGPLLPESVAVSVKLSPTSPEAFETWVDRTGFSQNENWPKTKSESVELGSCEDRVSARKLEKHPVSSLRAVRSMPPSYRAPAPP